MVERMIMGDFSDCYPNVRAMSFGMGALSNEGAAESAVRLARENEMLRASCNERCRQSVGNDCASFGTSNELGDGGLISSGLCRETLWMNGPHSA